MLEGHALHILKQLILLFSRGPEGLRCDAEASCLYCLSCVFCIAHFSPLCRDVVDRFSTLCTDTKVLTISLVMMQSSLGVRGYVCNGCISDSKRNLRMTRSCDHAMLSSPACQLLTAVPQRRKQVNLLTNREMKRWLRSRNSRLTQTGLEASRKPAR